MSDAPRYYKKGDAKPQGTPGKLQFFTMKFCPFGQRTWLTLEHKKIPYDLHFIGLREELPEWARESNPNGQVPIVEHNDVVLYESLVVCDYLDAAYPGDKLTSEDPLVRAKQAILVAEFSKVTSAFYGLAYNRGEREELWNNLLKALDLYERELNADFYGGNQPALVDYNIWPWIERILTQDQKLPVDRFPKFLAWTERMGQVPAVQNTRISDENHLQFFQSAIAGKADYALTLSRS